MKAPDTRAGGRYQAKERGMFNSDFNMEASERSYSSETPSDFNTCPSWAWRPFEKFFRELMYGDQTPTQ